jgi:RHS repeat-associated protein
VAAVNIAYDAANELTRWNSATTNLTYDNNGNLSTETQGGVTTTYTWDARNRLTGISRTGLTAAFVYDGLGRRNSKTINGTTTGFWYDGHDLYAELTGPTPSSTYIRGLSIDEAYIRKGASDEFYETDALGSSIALTNAAGASQTTYTYEPFGNTTQSGTASSNAFQYTGRENDITGLYYYRARYFSPKFHRFLTEDPLGLAAGVNVYAYTDNNPQKFTDPRGLDLVIRYYPLGAWGLGHVGVAVNTDGNDTVDTVAFGYEPSNANDTRVKLGMNVQGAVISDIGRFRGDTIRIRTSPDQDKAALAYIADRTANPGYYNLSGRNCSLFVVGVLKAAGIPIPTDPLINVPNVIFNHMKPYDDNIPRLRQR